jgi:outer membrane protein assembly factor BamB
VARSSGNPWAVAAVYAVFACALASACGTSQQAPTSARVPSLASKAASFADLEIDQSAHRVYAADRTDKGIDVFDVSGATAKYLSTVALPDTPNGLAVSPGRLYAGTGSGAVEVVDTLAGKVVSEIKTGAKEVDLIDVAPARGLLFASSGADGKLVTIDLNTGKVLSTANVGKPLEQPRYSSLDGMVYVSVPDLDALAEIDPKLGTVKQTLKLGGCVPRGLAIKPGSSTAVIACRKTMMSFDLRTRQSSSFGNVADADVLQYYPSVDRFFASAPHQPRPALVGMYGGEPVGFLDSTFVNGGGSAAVYDATNDVVYTTDSRAGTAGLTGFHMEGTRPTPISQKLLLALGPLALLVLLIVPVWLFLGRNADPINRKQRTPAAAPAVLLAKRKAGG